MRGRRMVAMTRARTLASGLGNPPLLQRLLDAVTCAFVCLVHSVRATFGMRFRHQPRDWHTGSVREALPQTKPGIHLKEDTPPAESLSALCRESLLANPKGLALSPLETLNRDSRDRPENDTVDVEALEACKARVPGEGRDPVSAHSALTTSTTVIPAEAHQRDELEPRSHARRRLRLPPLASGSRSRAFGMTPCMCVQISPV